MNSEQLNILKQMALGCVKCKLCNLGRRQVVFSSGSPSAKIMLVGEAPGADEDIKGIPFIGRAGQVLDKILSDVGITRDHVYITNSVLCRPPSNRKPEDDELLACASWLDGQIAIVSPKILVALGATPTKRLTGYAGAMGAVRGKWYNGKIPIMVTYHPAYLLRNPAAVDVVKQDFASALQYL